MFDLVSGWNIRSLLRFLSFLHVASEILKYKWWSSAERRWFSSQELWNLFLSADGRVSKLGNRISVVCFFHSFSFQDLEKDPSSVSTLWVLIWHFTVWWRFSDFQSWTRNKDNKLWQEETCRLWSLSTQTWTPVLFYSWSIDLLMVSVVTNYFISCYILMFYLLWLFVLL